jgi:hypothetical protein
MSRVRLKGILISEIFRVLLGDKSRPGDETTVDASEEKAMPNKNSTRTRTRYSCVEAALQTSLCLAQ